MNQVNVSDARNWQPRLDDAPGRPIYLQIAGAIERAIAEGELAAGARLPAQRELAGAMALSVGTVTSAYVEAERRGLVSRHVGRGTFVAAGGVRPRRRSGVIDLSANLPPYQLAAERIRTLLGQLVRDADVADLLGYPRPEGSRRYQDCVVSWLLRNSGFRHAAAAGEFVLCNGATQGLSIVLAHLLAPGDRVLCEARTYAGFKFAVAQLGCAPVAVAMDEEGIVPEALEEAAVRTGARVVQLVPTLQNPTGAIASMRRREAIVDVVRRRRLWVVEDDVYGALVEPPHRQVPLAELAPDRVFFVSSISKCVAPGLRFGWIRPPQDSRQALVASMAYQTAGANPFACLAFARLCETRAADEICGAMRTELARRWKAATTVLDLQDRAARPASPHLWLPVPDGQAERLHRRLAAMGILVTEPSLSEVGDGPVGGVRICLGAAESAGELEEALHVVKGELQAQSTLRTPAWNI